MDTEAGKGFGAHGGTTETVGEDAAVLAWPPEGPASLDAGARPSTAAPLWRRLLDSPRFLLSGSVVTFVVLWEVASRQGWIRDLFFSRPTSIVLAGIREVQKANFWTDVRISLTEFGLGFGLAVLIGIPLGLVLGWFRRLGYFWDPWLSFMYATPRITYIPLLVMWFGLGIASKVALCFAGPFFTIVIGTLAGVRTVPPNYLDVARSFGANNRQLFRTILLPNTVPFILAAMRLAVGIGIVAIVLGEMYASQDGLGHLLTTAANNLQADRVLFAVLIFTMMGVGLSKILRAVETRVAEWKPQTGS
jgi:NitT/TauT family transport system permease protein